MLPFKQHTGLAAALDRAHVDTDQIVPKQFLKRIERTGFGEFLFYNWRYHVDGAPNPDFPLNAPELRGASILVTGANFGCGSSREQAVWALQDYGFRVIIAPSFADIFYNNCFPNGMLPIRLPEEPVRELMRWVKAGGYRLTADLEALALTGADGFSAGFGLDPFRRRCLLEGLDDIGLTGRLVAKISVYESQRYAWWARGIPDHLLGLLTGRASD